MTLDAEIAEFLRTHRDGELMLRQFMRSLPVDVIVRNDSAGNERSRAMRQFSDQMAEAVRNGPIE